MRVQFGIYEHEKVFSKTNKTGECNFQMTSRFRAQSTMGLIRGQKQTFLRCLPAFQSHNAL